MQSWAFCENLSQIAQKLSFLRPFEVLTFFKPFSTFYTHSFASPRTRTPAYLEELRKNSFFLWFWWKIQIWNPYGTGISNSAGDLKIWGVVFWKTTLFFFKEVMFYSEKRRGPDKSSLFSDFSWSKLIWGVVFWKTTLFFFKKLRFYSEILG